MSGSPGNAVTQGGETQPRGCPAQGWSRAGLVLPWQHPAMNPWLHGPSRLLCHIYPLGNNSALRVTPEQQLSPYKIQLPEVQVYLTPIPYSTSPAAFASLPPAQPLKLHPRDLLQDNNLQMCNLPHTLHSPCAPWRSRPVQHPSSPRCMYLVPSCLSVPREQPILQQPSPALPSLCTPFGCCQVSSGACGWVPHQEDASPGIFVPTDLAHCWRITQNSWAAQTS